MVDHSRYEWKTDNDQEWIGSGGWAYARSIADLEMEVEKDVIPITRGIRTSFRWY